VGVALFFFCRNISTTINTSGEKTMNDPIHEAVQEHYGAIARSLNVVQPAAASCCGDTTAPAASDCSCSSSALYDASLLEGLPADVTGLSLG
jgi:hypothetical protein